MSQFEKVTKLTDSLVGREVVFKSHTDKHNTMNDSKGFIKEVLINDIESLFIVNWYGRTNHQYSESTICGDTIRRNKIHLLAKKESEPTYTKPKVNSNLYKFGSFKYGLNENEFTCSLTWLNEYQSRNSVTLYFNVNSSGTINLEQHTFHEDLIVLTDMVLITKAMTDLQNCINKYDSWRIETDSLVLVNSYPLEGEILNQLTELKAKDFIL